MDIPLTKNEIECDREPNLIRPWVLGKIREISETEEGRDAIRMKKGLAKVLVEECLPLGNFAHHFYSNDIGIKLRNIIGSQGYDVKVTGQNKKSNQLDYLEITLAHEGEYEHLRMIALKSHGHVSLLGGVTKSGTKNTGICVKVDSIAKSGNDILNDMVCRVSAAIRRKAKKVYPRKTGLIIGFDDYIGFSEHGQFELLANYVERNEFSVLNNFSLVCLVGSSGVHFKSWWL